MNLPTIKILSERTCKLTDGETYVVTDPCYVFGDCDWGRICNEVFFKFGDDGGAFTFGRSRPILFSGTMHGDGEYSVTTENGVPLGTFGVDAGMMCVIRKRDAIRIGGAGFSGKSPVCEFVSSGGSFGVENYGFVGEITCVTDGSDEDEEECDEDGDDDLEDNDDEFDDE